METAFHASCARSDGVWEPGKSYIEDVAERIDRAKKNGAASLSLTCRGSVLAIAGISTLILFRDHSCIQPCGICLSAMGLTLVSKGLVGMTSAKIRETISSVELISCFVR